MKNLKNWWLQILVVLGAIVELGFDVINPLLLEIGISDKTSNVLKLVFSIFVLLRTKLQLPTQNPEKLEAIVEAKKD